MHLYYVLKTILHTLLLTMTWLAILKGREEWDLS